MRIGNAASQQLQIDIYGEIADAFFQAFKGGMKPTQRGQALQPLISEHLATAWREPEKASGKCAEGGSISFTRR